MEGFEVRTSAFTTARRRLKPASAKRGKRPRAAAAGERKATPAAERAADVLVHPGSLTDPETVQVEFTTNAGTVELVVRVFSGREEEWKPVAGDALREGMEVLLRRESRLERAAERSGVEVEALLKSLEESVVGVPDDSAGIPEAERDALSAAGINLEGSPDDPTGAGEVLKGLARSARFRATALRVSEAATLLGKTEGRVRQMISAGQMETIPNGESGYLLPTWQFVDGQHVPGLAVVLKSAGQVHPLTLAGFMTRPDVDLEIDGQPASPVDWLLSGGDPGPVADLAASLGVLA